MYFTDTMVEIHSTRRQQVGRDSTRSKMTASRLEHIILWINNTRVWDVEVTAETLCEQTGSGIYDLPSSVWLCVCLYLSLSLSLSVCVCVGALPPFFSLTDVCLFLSEQVYCCVDWQSILTRRSRFLVSTCEQLCVDRLYRTLKKRWQWYGSMVSLLPTCQAQVGSNTHTTCRAIHPLQQYN